MSAMFPYPGLRPFHSSEADIFFGREEQTDDLLQKLSETRFLGIVGPSGCGKSSLVLAGMIPALEAGFMVSAGSRWVIARMRPGTHPMHSLAEALMEPELLCAKRLEENTLEILEERLQEGPKGLIGVLRAMPLPPNTNLLLLVDQFEELFRFRSERNRDEQDAFIALLLESAAEAGVSIYVVITMRSDYISDCAIFRGLPEALNRSQYLTPRLTREQRESAITGPARVFGGDVEPALINRLLNETGNDPNQLPVLQHLLMRLWSLTKPSKTLTHDNPFYFGTPAENLGHVLTIADYEAIGGLAEALSIHADQAYDTLNDAQKSIAEILFRTICERGSAHRDGRHPTPVSVIAERAGVPPEKIIEIVEIFRDPSFGFLVPSQPHKLFEDSVIDISHESLIKLWKRLSKWVEEEAKAAETYRFLEQSAKRWKEGTAALWSTPNLETGLEWKEKEHPDAEWAERYGGNFHVAMEFLEASLEKKRADEAEKEVQRQLELRKTKRWLKLSISAVVGGMIAIALYFYCFIIPYQTYSRSFTKRWGVIYPVGPLNESAVAHRSWTLRLTSKGRLNPVHLVEVIDSNSQPTPYHSISTYLTDWYKTEKEEKPVRYEFVYDLYGKVVYEVAWNRFKKRSWTFVRIPTNQNGINSNKGIFDSLKEKILLFFGVEPEDSKVTSIKGFFIDAEGYPKPQGHSRAEVIAIQYDKQGFECLLTYFDRNGNPQPGPDNAFGIQIVYDESGREIRRTSLSEQKRPVNDDFGNASLYHKYDKDGNVIESRAYDASGAPTLIRSGISIARHKYDEWGNELESAYFGLSGEPVQESELFSAHKIKYDYDKKGNVISIKLFGISGDPIVGVPRFFEIDAHEKRTAYDSQNKVVSEFYYNTSKDTPVFADDGWCQVKYEYDPKGFVGAINYLDSNAKPIKIYKIKNDSLGRTIDLGYFLSTHKPGLTEGGYHRKRSVYDRAGNVIKETYFDTRNRPVPDKNNEVLCVKSSYNIFGHLRYEEFCDLSEKRMNGKYHFSRIEYKYDRFGNNTETRWFDKDSIRCAGPDGFHFLKNEYNQHTGKLIKAARFDIADKPVQGNDGIHEIDYFYNDKRQQTKIIYFGVDHKRVENAQGSHLKETQYDNKGRVVNQLELRADFSPNYDRSLGVARVAFTYNRENRFSGQSFYDNKNHLVTSDIGFAKAIINYYPDQGMMVSMYGADGKRLYNPVYGFSIRFNSDHISAFYGPDGKLITGPYGYAEQRLQNDKKDNLIAISWFGADGKPAIGTEGYHRIEQTLDGKSVRYYDTENRLVTSADKYPLAQVLFIERLIDIKKPAYKIGLCAGDIIWKYGSWSYPAVYAANSHKMAAGKIPDAAFLLFKKEVAQRAAKTVSMTVLRNGRPVEIRVPSLPDKVLGLQRSDRKIPLAQFERWKKMSP